ncbi:MAG: NUDIX domain-containing protein [Candidatus Magasanikbacteria bacterium]|jgi:ADP-ribose pyrophosphatase YjhB (NUDIX family)|nr:NUDIX domain-containing protein [Candidatus Magasanikbacteria bacterium]MBT4221443.1 NUDIX domain-containing protein [Candidatus Magasanikbacteria bacterium]MBT4350709.1 NUDIX domain-containing protein [Candidatus Magasanikbacteria bacterium]MBT4541615.1 NUDIX domain-containing protein [Candidatus Magasanikbacteria bacterium]MBT6252942.1 NUDIX domain-containing protein [Candidatus Magasanikbacteria bacterium]
MDLPANTIIASGPVIIENNKVLLNKEQKKDMVTPWLFPGGEVEDIDISLEEACKREVFEEMGLEIDIIRAIKPMMVYRPESPKKLVILIHWLSSRKGEITPGENVVQWGWHDIHNLPDDCAPNIYAVIDSYIQEQSRL